ncbi:putative pentatricopeptide repeat-containing protein At3g11460, mitochondrial [Malania oleifera]|uniref:putative pentatricopeptide repeat-containing protein At3g11460, mitochondrial n=1 Tax=Malania oleifera TaxID=397392 RepID=UPI0025AE05D3|nr:putative pentatricopeptide repeat-containing protein At3g11460, mitochondrial [Malania oleifera]
MTKANRFLNFQISNGCNATTPWNTHLRELAKHGHFREGLILYRQMLRSGDSPNAFSFPFALKSCAALSLPAAGAQLHGHVIKTGCVSEPFVQSSLIALYSKCSLIENARKVFDEVAYLTKSTVCHNALISGFTLNSRYSDAVSLFCFMRRMGVPCDAVTMLGLVPVCTLSVHLELGMCIHACNVKFGLDNDVAVGNCLLTMYVRCGSVGLARKLFNEMPKKELITWNAMISGYAQNGLAANVLELYREMDSMGICADAVTLLGVLSSCAHLGAQSVGREVERRIECGGFGLNPFLKNALINMYARCGNLVKARAIFDDMPVKSLISWTAIIGGYGMHGHGEIAVQLFDKMVRAGVQPDGTVFVCVLSACSHAGLTDKGLDYFAAMGTNYGLQPGLEHYSCMVDLLGRAGRFDEARNLIESMSMEPDGAVWGALLGACKIHKNVDLAELAFERVNELEPMNIGYYVLLSNIYSEAKNSDGVLRIRVMMRERKLRKEPGCSYVEHKGRMHLFLAGDRTHPQTEEIYRMLEHLEDLVKELGGSKSSDEERCDEELMTGMGVHSEKLAIAFGLLNTEAGAEIVIIKNLRVCGDCHVFIKLVSKILDRHFVVRDATRFHHFEDGVCSCKDYW